MKRPPQPSAPHSASTSSPTGNQDVGERLLVRNSVLLVGIEIFSKLLGLILFAFIARFLGADDLGLYAFAIALANFFAIAPRFGFEKRVQKEVGRNAALLYPHFREINVIKASFSIVALVCLWLLLWLTGAPDTPIVMLIAIFVFAYTFLQFTNSLFRGIGKPEFEVLVRAVFSLLNVALGIAALIAGWGLWGIVSAHLVSAATAMLTGYVIIWRVAEKTSYGGKTHALWRHVKAAAPFALMLLTLYFGNQIGIVIIRALIGKAEVGYYAASMRLYESLALIPAAIMGAFLPTMSNLFKTSVGRFVRTLRFALKYLFVISSPIAIGTILIAPRLIAFIYGEEFAPAAPVLQVLMVVLIFSFWNHALTSVLIACNREKLLLWILAGGAVFHVAANLLFIPMLSFIGAGWASLATRLVLFVGYIFILRRYLRVGSLLRLVAPTMLSTAVMGAAVFLLRDWNLAFVIACAAVIYTSSLFLTSAVSRSDLDSLKGIIRAR